MKLLLIECMFASKLKRHLESNHHNIELVNFYQEVKSSETHKKNIFFFKSASIRTQRFVNILQGDAYKITTGCC